MCRTLASLPMAERRLATKSRQPVSPWYQISESTHSRYGTDLIAVTGPAVASLYSQVVHKILGRRLNRT